MKIEYPCGCEWSVVETAELNQTNYHKKHRYAMIKLCENHQSEITNEAVEEVEHEYNVKRDVLREFVMERQWVDD